ncbi:MAG: hypothetical protein SFW08_09315 [Gemmatimonadaceae bacterium]|nr:hypothetical protein [Gemmatimonadaceae bacterium]
MADEYVPTPTEQLASRVALGCVTTIVGAAGGGMLGTMVSKFVGSYNNCNPGEGLPACDWHIYAGIGAVLGVMLIPSLAFWRLRASARGDRSKT